ncbi:MAG: DUF1697 domain-containing protein [Lentimicrobiaceae bacterium]|nr:DUF1697 domain-containing protein [Lentimicrobiaceae bacterium]
MLGNLHIALLRGINVGGNNIIRMTDLKSCFENMGYGNVTTYIQSDNVIFSTNEKDNAQLESKTEKFLSEKFNYTSRVVIITHEQLAKIVKEAPQRFGSDAGTFRYDVAFLKEPLTSAEAIKNIAKREGVDNIYEGKSVLYFSRLISNSGQSFLNKLINLPVYKEMTIRNWNTATKLLALMAAKKNNSEEGT